MPSAVTLPKRWDLRQQVRRNGCIANTVTDHHNRPQFQRFGIDPDVHLASLPATAGPMLSDLPFAFARELDPRAVHQKMEESAAL